MTDQDIKKLAKVVKMVVSHSLNDDFYEKIRKIIRSEIDYALSNSSVGTNKSMINDNIPEDKMQSIKEATSKKRGSYVDPKEKLKKMREMNSHVNSPDVDIYEDNEGKTHDLSENKKLDSFKKKDYGALLD